MPQRVKVLKLEPYNLREILGTGIKGKGKNQLHKLTSDFYTHTHHAHTYTIVIKNIKNLNNTEQSES